MEPADNVPANELLVWCCSVAQLRGTSVSYACCESPLKLHTIVPTFDNRTQREQRDGRWERAENRAVEISNWQTNFPAVTQGVANSVSYIMEHEFYCFRKFQHINLLKWSSPSAHRRCRSSLLPPRALAVAVASACQGLPCRHTHVSLSQPSAQLCGLLHHIHLHIIGSAHTHTQLAITRQTGRLRNRRVYAASRLLLAYRSHT